MAPVKKPPEMSREKANLMHTIDRKSRDDFFDDLCICLCEKCTDACSSTSHVIPCWYRSRLVRAGLVKTAYLRGLRDPCATIRQETIESFNALSRDDHTGFDSDILHLTRIDSDGLASLLDKWEASPEADMVMEAAHTLHLLNWKTDLAVLGRVKRILDDKGQLDQPLVIDNVKEYESLLRTHREMLNEMTEQLFLFSMLSFETICDALARFNGKYNYGLAHAFVKVHPWAECYLYNFRTVLTAVWSAAGSQGKVKREKFVYPTAIAEKGVTMMATMLPKPGKDEACSMCKAKIDKSVNVIYPIEFAYSVDANCFPRKALLEFFEEAKKRMVGTVCQEKCLWAGEMGKDPTLQRLDVFMKSVSQKDAEKGLEKVKHLPVRRLMRHYFKLEVKRDPAKPLLMSDFVRKMAENDMSAVAKIVKEKNAVAIREEDSKDFFLETFGIKDGRLASHSLKRDFAKDRHEHLIRYRCKISEALAGSGQGILLAQITLVWDSKWGGITKHCQNTHRIQIKIKTSKAFESLQPKYQNHDQALAQCFMRKESVFFPVDNHFFDYANYAKGFKFLAEGSSSDHETRLRAILGDNDAILFVNKFDVRDRCCRGGFLYLCQKSKKVVGVALCDMYRYMMADIDFEMFVNASNRYQKTEYSLKSSVPVPSKKGEVSAHVSKSDYKVKKAVMFILSLVAQRNYVDWIKGNLGDFPEFPLPYYRLVFRMTHLLNLDGKPVEVGYAVAVPKSEPVGRTIEYFEKVLGEFYPTRLKFSYGDSSNSTEVDPGSLPPERFSLNESFVIEVKPKQPKDKKTPNLAIMDTKLIFEDKLPLCRLSVKHSIGDDTIEEHKFYMLRDQPFKHLVSHLEKPDMTQGCIVTECSFTFRHASLKDVPSETWQMDDLRKLTPDSLANRTGLDLNHEPIVMDLVQRLQEKKQKSEPQALFDRAFFWDHELTEHHHRLVWKGAMTFFGDESRSQEYQKFVWITVREDIVEEMLSVLFPMTKHWGPSLTGCFVENKQFLKAVKDSGVLRKCINVALTFGPSSFGEEDDQVKTQDLMKLFGLAGQLCVVPFIYDKRETFMLLEVSTCGHGLLFSIPVDVGLAHSVLQKIPDFGEMMKSGGKNELKGFKGKNEFNFEREEPTYLKGVLAGKVLDEPIFAIPRASKELDLKDFFSNPVEGESACPYNGSHYVFVVERSAVESALGQQWEERGKPFDMDVYFGKEFPKWVDAIEIPGTLFMVFRGTREELRELKANNKDGTLSKHLFLFTFVSDNPSKEFVGYHFKHQERLLLSKMLFKRKSQLFNDVVSDSGLALDKAIRVLKAEAEADERRSPPKKVKSEEEELASKLKSNPEKTKPAVDTAKAAAAAAQSKKGEKEKTSKPVNGKAPVKSETQSKAPARSSRVVEPVDVDGLIRRARALKLKEGKGKTSNFKVTLDVCCYCKEKAYDMASCSQCMVTNYCSQRCIERDFRNHDKECKEVHHSRTEDVLKKMKGKIDIVYVK